MALELLKEYQTWTTPDTVSCCYSAAVSACEEGPDTTNYYAVTSYNAAICACVMGKHWNLALELLKV